MLVLSAGVGIIACGSSQKEEGDQPGDFSLHLEEAAADSVLMALSFLLHADPVNREQREQNTLLDYALEKTLPVGKTRSGLYYAIIDPGKGAALDWGDRVAVHYRGHFPGEESYFDNSFVRGKPLEFYIGNMIPAWNEGLQLLHPGGKMVLLSPSRLAYGSLGLVGPRGDTIVPAHQPLIFELAVQEVLKRANE